MRDEQRAEITMTDQAKRTQECFMIHDKSGSGKIACSELGTLVRCLGQRPTQAEIDQVVAETLRGKGQFDMKDLDQVMTVMSKRCDNSEESLRDAFSVFDRDGSGYISAAEIRHVLTTLGERLSEAEVDEMIQEFEMGGDGRISYDDFVSRVMG